jgi:hypothetical protein
MTATSGVPIILAGLRPGSLIDVETKSRHYRIECLGGSEIRISGHPEYCLTPVAAHLHGSIDSAGALEPGLIERGSKLMFFLNGNRPLTTSRVVSLHVDQPKAVSPSSSSIH